MMDVETPRDFEWDEAKATSNVGKHGVPFEFAAAVFLDAARADFDASQPEDGEARRKVVGTIAGCLFTVVYTRRDVAIRFISARRSNAQEARRYENR